MATLTSFEEAKATQRNNWNAAATRWERWDTWFQKQTQPVSDWICRAAGLAPGHKVLDVACGSGEPAITAAEIVRPNGYVTAVDLADEMLCLARSKAARRARYNVEFLEMDAEHLQLNDDDFDAATCRWGLMFFPEPIRAAREIARVLRRNGSFVTTTWAAGDDNPWISMPGRVASRFIVPSPVPPDAIGPLRLSDAEMLSGILADSGFRSVSVTALSFFLEFESLEEYWTNASTFSAPIENALGALALDQVKNLRRALLNEASQYLDGGTVRFPARAWGCYGVK
jgi:ubiquinone/menaquinone biosynthesis C-methylase UbiE